MNQKIRVFFIVATILGLAMFFSNLLGAEECPPKEIDVLNISEVPMTLLREIVDSGGVLLEDEEYIVLIDVTSERAEGYDLPNLDGTMTSLVGVFAYVSVGKTLGEMGVAECRFVASPNVKQEH